MEHKIMTRTVSSALTSGGFLVSILITSILLGAVPIIGALFSAALYFGSPFLWLVISMKDKIEITAGIAALAVYAPYPVAGAIIGSLRPIQAPCRTAVVRNIFLRFLVFLVLILGTSICLALYAAANDS